MQSRSLYGWGCPQIFWSEMVYFAYMPGAKFLTLVFVKFKPCLSYSIRSVLIWNLRGENRVYKVTPVVIQGSVGSVGSRGKAPVPRPRYHGPGTTVDQDTLSSTNFPGFWGRCNSPWESLFALKMASDANRAQYRPSVLRTINVIHPSNCDVGGKKAST